MACSSQESPPPPSLKSSRHLCSRISSMLVFSPRYFFLFHHHIVPKGISSACGTPEHALCYFLVFFFAIAPSIFRKLPLSFSQSNHAYPFPMELLGSKSIAMSFKQSYYIPLTGPQGTQVTSAYQVPLKIRFTRSSLPLCVQR